MKLTITRISRKSTDKDGNPLMTSDHRPYERLGIKVREYGEKWLSGFSSQWNQDWKEGDTVDADVEENGQYLNLKKPDPMSELFRAVNRHAAVIPALEKRIVTLEGIVDRLERKDTNTHVVARVKREDEAFDVSGAPIVDVEDIPPTIAPDDLPF